MNNLTLSLKDCIMDKNNRYFHRIMGVDSLDIDSIYEDINNIFYIVSEMEDRHNLKLMEKEVTTALPLDTYSKKADLILSGDFTNVQNNLDAFKMVLSMFDYKNHVDKLTKLIFLMERNPDNKNILFFGDISYEEVLFLFYKFLSGVNVFYFSTNIEFNNFFQDIDINNKYTTVDLKENSWENIKFPTKKLINRQTDAYKASKEIETIMYNENSNILKPFVFDNHKVSNINLITTYEELKIILKEDARVRPKFSYDDEYVYIPNIVTKISGVEEKLKDYKALIKDLTDLEGSTIFDIDTKTNALRQHGPLSRQVLKSYCIFDNEDVFIDIEKFAESKDFQHSFLKLSAQRIYLEKINILINSKNIFKFNSTSEEKLDMALSLLKMSYPNICEILHSYNYYGNIPKVFIFASQEIKPDKAKTLSVLISFMSLLAFDVILIVPSGYTDVERFILDNLIKTHKLPKVNQKLSLKDIRKKGFLF